MGYVNPFAWNRNRKPGQYEYNPNAEMPEPVMNGSGVSITTQPNGKLWDDSEVSDEEMDRLMDKENASMNILGSIRMFRPE